jgi:hypothetical protein
MELSPSPKVQALQAPQALHKLHKRQASSLKLHHEQRHNCIMLHSYISVDFGTDFGE